MDSGTCGSVSPSPTLLGSLGLSVWENERDSSWCNREQNWNCCRPRRQERHPEPRVLEWVSRQLPGSCQNAEPCWGARGIFQNGRGGATGAFESVSTQGSPLFSFGLRAGWSPQNHGSGAVVVALSLFCKLVRGMTSHLLRGHCTWTGTHLREGHS